MSESGELIEVPNGPPMMQRHVVVYDADERLVHTYTRVDVGDPTDDDEALITQALEGAQALRKDAMPGLRAVRVDPSQLAELSLRDRPTAG